MKISFITTVYNEEKTINKFLDSLFAQTKLPNEIIIVDGASNDNTIAKIKKLASKVNKKKIRFKSIIKSGNRSIGRNEAIKNATGDIIVCSDSGNILDKNWLKNIIKPFRDKTVDVVAGYYRGEAKTIFQKCVIPYALVMEDKLDPEKFLPATRSIAFKKSIWRKIGKFDESLSHNEDYVFARKLKKLGAKIVFAKDAIVNWIPRSNFKQTFKMLWRFAFGDAEALIFRPKVLFVFLRYFVGAYILFSAVYYHSLFILLGFAALIILYMIWSVQKNYRYVKETAAFYYLPLLQFTADTAVLSGTFLGILSKFTSFIKKNILLSLIILTYIILVSIRFSIGTPNIFHPFLYHMDEWHQLMAVKAIVKHGTTTIEGAAQIPFLYPVLSGIYLIPFILLHIVNPFVLRTPLGNLEMQQTLFEVLRSVNLWFGIGSILLMAYLAKRYFKINHLLTAFFFTISPIFLMLSGYFKYDIGLLFFIILSLALILKWSETQTTKNYIYAAIACGLAFSTKFSAAPLVPLLFFAYVWYTRGRKRDYKVIVYGLLAFLLTFLFIGVPNVLFGKADFGELLYSNLISGPQETNNMLLSLPWWQYLTIVQFPFPFGHLAYLLGIAGFLYGIVYTFLNSYGRLKEQRHIVFLLVGCILFIVSLIPLKIGAGSNRVLVLLPFLSLFSAFLISKLATLSRGIYRYIFIFLVSLVIIFQSAESLVWVYTSMHRDPQKESSDWIRNNIPANSLIGIETAAIYQALPNLVIKEFYGEQYKLPGRNIFRYEVIDSKTKKLPSIIVISNDQIHKKLYKETPKKSLINRIENEGYKKVAIFSPDLHYFKLIGNDEDYYMSSLIASPATITVYEKNN